MQYLQQLFLFLFILPSLLMSQTSFTILHTNNINGTLENCLCAEHPYGSVEKIKRQVDKIREATGNVIFVDCGDFFSPFGNMQKDLFAADALQLLNYDVCVPGDQEFSNGFTFFRIKVNRLGIPYTSLNLSVEGMTEFTPFREFQFDETKVALLSLTAKSAFRYYPPEIIDKIQIEEPRLALERFFDSTNETYNYIIVASHMGLEADKQLAENFPQIDLLIGGHSQDVLEEALVIGRTKIVQAGSEGYYLGKVEVGFSETGKLQEVNSELMAMEIDLPNDSQISELAKTYNFQFIRKAVEKQNLPKPIERKFIIEPAETCGACHEKQYSSWQSSAHSHSWDSLERENKSKLARCVVCHTSGFGRSDGYINANLTAEYTNVLCTECHWTEKEHLVLKNSNTVKTIEPSRCIRCHDDANDPDFDFERDLLKLHR